MPRTPSQSDIAGDPRRAAARGRDAGQRRHPDAEMRRLVDLADDLERLRARPNPSTDDHDRIVDLVEQLAAGWCGMKAYYRGPSSRPCHPPLHVSADGARCVW